MNTPASGLAAEFSRRTRVASSRSAAMRSGRGRPNTSLQPGSMCRAQKLPRFMFMATRMGMVSATTRAPSAPARSQAVIWLR